MKARLIIILIITTSLYSNSLYSADSEFDSRIWEIIDQMTLEEKTIQLSTEYLNAVPRLNLPEYDWHNEALHGLVSSNITVFPVSIALGATFDSELVRQIGDATSDEGRIKFKQGKIGLTYWSPNLDIVRDPRWGRGQETYGEDPYLASRMGVAYIKGLQGDDEKYLKAIPSPKHFAVHSGPEALRFNSDPITSQRDVWETYMPPFKAAIEEGKSYSIMMAYNAYQGIPMSVNKYMIQDIIRGKWGLEGFVMNDCGGLSVTRWQFDYCGNEIETVACAIDAGLDLECGEYYNFYLKDAVEQGFVEEAKVDTTVYRLLKARFKLGLFDPPEIVPFSSIPDSIVECQKHKDLSLKAANESMVLLKNEGDLLPLSKDVGSILMIGPNVDTNWEMLGAYAGYPSQFTTAIEGIEQKVSPNTKITELKGCDLDGIVMEFADSKHFKTSEGLPGLIGEYFSNKDLEGEPVMTRIDSVIDFHWLRQSPIEGMDRGKPFSVRWTGTITMDHTAEFKFAVLSNDGARLYIDDSLIVDSWWDHGVNAFHGYDSLESGVEYPFILEYYFNQAYSHVWVEFGSDQTGKEVVAAAVEEAIKHDIIIFVGGISRNFEGEMMDRKTIDLPIGQENLLKALKTTGKPIVLVLYSGSCFAINWANDSIPAILQAWYGGQEAGLAVANIIFGDYNPSGRLPVTFYKSDNDLPDFENYFMDGRTYRFFRGEPLYPFGFGLSYTEFEYNKLIIEKHKIDINETDFINVKCSITNIGDMAGDEVVQLYIKNLTSNLPQPIKQLKGFSRINLQIGETKLESINVKIDDLFYFDTLNQEYDVEPGLYEIQLGASSTDIRLTGTIELIDTSETNVERNDEFELIIIPNPSEDYFSIPSYIGEIIIYDLLNNEVLKREVFFGQKINISHLANGIYFVKLRDMILKLVKY